MNSYVSIRSTIVLIRHSFIRITNIFYNKMASKEEQLKSLAVKLHQIDAFKFGNYKLKSGGWSPVYFDLRVIISYPDVMKLLSELLLQFVADNGIQCDSVCGVPYTALPIATLYSIKDNKPMLIRRKETKQYGTKKLIEGKYSAGDKCLIIEDVVSSGLSVLETAKDLKSEGIVVNDTIVVVNREQGGASNIESNGIHFHSLFTLSQLLKILKEAGTIDQNTVQSVSDYIKDCQIVDAPKVISNERLKMTYEARIESASCPIAKKLLQIIASKKTNLCLAADATCTDAVLNAAAAAGPYICVLKTHVDIIDDFNQEFIKALRALAKKHNFLIMEDRKFADIGNTVSLQYSSGIYRIAEWADLVTVHSLIGPSILKGLKSVLSGSTESRGVFLLAEISSNGSLTTSEYTTNTMKLASDSEASDFVVGIVCQNGSVVNVPGLLQLTPGCRIDSKADSLGQQYDTPEHVVKEKGADIAVVGRGIMNAKDVQASAQFYRDRLWSAYCNRVGISN